MAACEPGAVISEIARQFDIASSMIYKWRRQAVAANRSLAFVPAVVAVVQPSSSDAPAEPPPAPVAIMVEFSAGVRVVIDATAPPEAAIRDLLNRHPKRLRTNDVEDVAWELGTSRATLYRLIARYRQTGTVEGLYGPGSGRRGGTQFLHPDEDMLIREMLQKRYLRPTRPPFQRVLEEIAGAYRSRGWPAPTWRPVKARLRLIDQRMQAIRRKDSEAIRAMTPTPGEYTAARPLDVVQIDHTQVDVIIVDEQSREPMGRPWITLAVDIRTRMVAGFHLALEAPSRVSIGLCLLHAVYDKTAWMLERGIDAPWPVAGLPQSLHADNGSDFRSQAFVRACRNQGVQVIWRARAR